MIPFTLPRADFQFMEAAIPALISFSGPRAGVEILRFTGLSDQLFFKKIWTVIDSQGNNEFCATLFLQFFYKTQVVTQIPFYRTNLDFDNNPLTKPYDFSFAPNYNTDGASTFLQDRNKLPSQDAYVESIVNDAGANANSIPFTSQPRIEKDLIHVRYGYAGGRGIVRALPTHFCIKCDEIALVCPISNEGGGFGAGQINFAWMGIMNQALAF